MWDFGEGGSEGEFFGCFFEVALVHFQSVFLEFEKGVFRDFRGDEGVSVTVSTDPAGEAKFGIGVFFAEVFDVPAGVFPCEFEGAI